MKSVRVLLSFYPSLSNPMTSIKLTPEQIAQVLAENEQVEKPPVKPTPKPKPPTPPKPTPGATSWRSFFGQEIDWSKTTRYGTPPYTSGKIIPKEGVAIAFDVPVGVSGYLTCLSAESVAISTRRQGSINETPLDFESGETAIWGTGSGLRVGFNYPHSALPTQLEPGRYFLNLRNMSPTDESNYIKAQVYIGIK